MKFHTEITKGAAIIQPRGREMAMGEADIELRHVFLELRDAGVRTMILDLSRVRKIDGPCLQEILSFGKELEAAGGELALMSPGIDDVSSLVTLLQDLRSYPGREEALGGRVSRMKVVASGALRMLDDVLGKKVALKVPA